MNTILWVTTAALVVLAVGGKHQHHEHQDHPQGEEEEEECSEESSEEHLLECPVFNSKVKNMNANVKQLHRQLARAWLALKASPLSPLSPLASLPALPPAATSAFTKLLTKEQKPLNKYLGGV